MLQMAIEKPKPVVFPKEHFQLIRLAVTEYEKAALTSIPERVQHEPRRRMKRKPQLVDWRWQEEAK
jgi:hypothetical protein